MVERKTCKGCQHSAYGRGGVWVCERTADLDAIEWDRLTGSNVCDGNPTPCKVERTSYNRVKVYIYQRIIGLYLPDRCGPEGKHWEERKRPPLDIPARRSALLDALGRRYG